MRHQHIRLQLYDYASGALPEHDRRLVDEHLDRCTACREELRLLDRTLATLASTRTASTKPSAERPAEFWVQLADDIERSLAASRPKPRWRLLDVLESGAMLVRTRRWFVYAVGACLAAVAAALLVLPRDGSPPLPAEPERLVTQVSETDTDTRVSEYFRRSRTLLVEIANMRDDRMTPANLTAEQQFSRALLQEARSLRQRNLDRHAARLVNDLEKILIGFANLDPSRGSPDVELIRNGILQENLLFKLRMAEMSYDTAAIQFTNDSQ